LCVRVCERERVNNVYSKKTKTSSVTVALMADNQILLIVISYYCNNRKMIFIYYIFLLILNNKLKTELLQTRFI